MRNNLLSTLAYYDMFHYPLTAEELYNFSEKVVDQNELESELSRLVSQQVIFQSGNFFSLQPGETLANRRTKGNTEAEKQFRIAAKVCRLLSYFPYIRAIGISGSLSKNYADESSDIDLFIITAKNRMWIARTILCLFRKLFIPFGKTHWLCMNYFIDETRLEIVEKNYFTAMEIVTLVPMRGIGTFNEFFKINAWARSYFPNHEVKNQFISECKEGIVKSLLERIFRLRIFDSLENRLMLITNRRYKEKTERGQLNKRGLVVSMSVSRHFSKPNPNNFQFKLMETYERKLRELLLQPDVKAAAI